MYIVDLSPGITYCSYIEYSETSKNDPVNKGRLSIKVSLPYIYLRIRDSSMSLRCLEVSLYLWERKGMTEIHVSA